MLKLLSNNFYRLSGGSVTLLALLILPSFIVFSYVTKRIVPRPSLEGGTPKDAATIDAFLLSTEAEWITGQITSVEDGRSTLPPNVSKMEIDYGRNSEVFRNPETQRN